MDVRAESGMVRFRLIVCSSRSLSGKGSDPKCLDVIIRPDKEGV